MNALDRNRAEGHKPDGVGPKVDHLPRVTSPARQPRAAGRNPLGIPEASHRPATEDVEETAAPGPPARFRSAFPARFLALAFALALAFGPGFGGAGFATAAHAADSSPQPFRLAFSANMFAEINESDVRAAMKVWIMTVARDRNVPVDSEMRICRTSPELEQMGQSGEIDGLGLLTTEFAALRRSVEFDRFALAIVGGQFTEEYVVLVHRDSGLEQVRQLPGCTLKVLNSPRMSLAMIWLDTVLLEAGLPVVTNAFQHVDSHTKTTAVALPVFFRQTAACLITRNTFRVMSELNPQLRRQLRPILISPPLVPSGFAFRAHRNAPLLELVLREMVHLGESPAGRQILALTKADRIEEHSASSLNDSLDLIARHQRLRESRITPSAPPTPSASASASASAAPPGAR